MPTYPCTHVRVYACACIQESEDSTALSLCIYSLWTGPNCHLLMRMGAPSWQVVGGKCIGCIIADRFLSGAECRPVEAVSGVCGWTLRHYCGETVREEPAARQGNGEAVLGSIPTETGIQQIEQVQWGG